MNSYDIYDHDWENEAQLIEKMGAKYYEEVKRKLVDYYSVLNHLCAIGQVEKMYIPPVMDLSKGIIQNQNLFEQKMARDLCVRKGNQVLDIGCGRGRVASHIASITGANVVGINIDAVQLEHARQFALGKGLSQQCRFQFGDLNDIPYPFKNNSLDGVYHVQVFSLAKDLLKLFKELHRILKPGGRFACLDWVCLDKYDSENKEHAELMKRIKPLIGAIGTPSVDKYVSLLKEAGFKVLVSENASVGGYQAPLIDRADKFYTRVTRALNFFVRYKILPKHFKVLFDRLTKDGQAFVEADRRGLVTTSYYIVAEKM